MPITWMKSLVGFSLVGIHGLSMILAFVWLDPRLEVQQWQAVVLTLAPLSALYVLAFTRDVVTNMQGDPDKRRVSANFVVLTVIVILAFGVAVLYSLYQFKTTVSLRLEDLQVRLGIVETLLGVILGTLVAPLFGQLKE